MFYCFSFGLPENDQYLENNYRGFSAKAPGGWGFFPPILAEASLKKNPTPLGLFVSFLGLLRRKSGWRVQMRIHFLVLGAFGNVDGFFPAKFC